MTAKVISQFMLIRNKLRISLASFKHVYLGVLNFLNVKRFSKIFLLFLFFQCDKPKWYPNPNPPHRHPRHCHPNHSRNLIRYQIRHR